MKKVIVVALVACLVLAFVGCKTKPPASSGMPSNVAYARRNAPEDVLVGIGTARMANVAQSRSLAATRARAEISNTMNVMIKNMASDYWASSEVDPQAQVAFAENITVTLSKSNLSGAVIQFEEPDNDGNWWCVMYLSKSNVTREISQAQAAARLAVPQAASIDATARMDEMFEKAKREDW